MTATPLHVRPSSSPNVGSRRRGDHDPALDPDTLTSVCCPAFDYDVIRWGWGSDPDPGFLLGVTTCQEIPTGFSETGYCDEGYDELYADQGRETDRDARIEIVHQMQQQLIDDVPYIVPYYSGWWRHGGPTPSRAGSTTTRPSVSGAGDADGAPSDRVIRPSPADQPVARPIAANGRRPGLRA